MQMSANVTFICVIREIFAKWALQNSGSVVFTPAVAENAAICELYALTLLSIENS